MIWVGDWSAVLEVVGVIGGLIHSLLSFVSISRGLWLLSRDHFLFVQAKTDLFFWKRAQ